MVSNLFGTLDRARFIFRDTLPAVRRLVELKIDPGAFWRHPLRYLGVPATALHMLPKRVRGGPILAHEARLSELPALRCWPADGGPFITLPQVYTEDPDRPGPLHSNLGMYRIQLAGGSYERDREVGLHYQIHRGIGVHQAAAIRRGQHLSVSVFVGGPPAFSLAAVMPLPEGLSELAFAGALSGRRVRLIAGRAGEPHADPRRRRLLPRRHRRSEPAQTRRPLRRSPRVLQPGARLPGVAGENGSTTARTRSGPSRSWAGRPRRTPCSES